MRRMFGLGLLCATAALGSAHAETFVIAAEAVGHEATVKIPAGAVTKLSADRAESLDGFAGPQVEAMRLSGDVCISIAGSTQPILVKADSVVLELTPDSLPGHEKPSRSDAATNKVLRSTTTLAGDEVSQVFQGNVVFNLQTSSGPVQIKADKVEHQLNSEAGA